MTIEGGYPNGSSGYAGGTSSRDRAEREDSTGITGWRSQAVYNLLADEGPHGQTCHEIERHMNIGHGAASGALTRLHRSGKIVRLEERRVGQEVYVIPEFVKGRPTVDYRPNVGRIDEQAIEEIRRVAKQEALREAAEAVTRNGEDGMNTPALVALRGVIQRHDRRDFARWLEERAKNA